MKVLMITPCTLPVPAVHGGAVQQLIDTIIKQNELEQRMNLTVVGLWDNIAEQVSKRYKYTQFVFWKEPDICRFLDGCYEKVYHLITGKTHRALKLHIRKLYIIHKLEQLLLKNDYDAVVFENMGYQLRVFKNKNVHEKIKGISWYHLHNEIPDSVCREHLSQVKLMLISSYLSKKVNARFGQNIVEMKVVKNGINVECFGAEVKHEELKLLKDKLQISNNDKVIIFVGRMIPEKGIEETIDAFLKIQQQHQDTVLLIVGSLNFGLERVSDFEIRIRKKCECAKEKIVFTGYVPQNEVHKYYKIADVAVLPSIWNEPAGLTMLEAAACGVPVITTEVGGIPEYLNRSYSQFVKRDARIVDTLVECISEVFVQVRKWKDNALKQKEYVEEHFSEKVFYQTFVDTIEKPHHQ